MNQHIGKVVLPLARRDTAGVIYPLGTCFAVGSRLLATAAHATGPSDEGLVAIVGIADSLSDYQDVNNTEVQCSPLRIVNYHPLFDIAILEFVDASARVGFDYGLSGTDEVVPGTPVLSLGYPHADHGRLVLTQHSSLVGARVLLTNEGFKIKHVVLNTQTRPGQSGGPVFTGDGKKICAMVLGGYKPPAGGSISLGGIDPQTLHQTTHAVSAEYISRLL